MAVRVPPDEVDVARAQLLELFPEGFEELEGARFVELAVYTSTEGEARLGAVFRDVSSTPVEEGWEHGWRAFHRPVLAGGLWIGPPWIEAPADAPAVVVDPGRAFGTGAHPTTRACVELLAGLDRGSLVDAGCGSGVVAVAAARLGFAPVTALDADPVAVEVARRTAHVNGVEVDVREADVLRDHLASCDVLVANIELRVVEALLDRAPARVALTAGYLERERPRATGWTHTRRLEQEGWAADVWVAK